MLIFRRRRHAFTFLEIMFVVVIIGILLAVAAPRLTGKSKKARIQATRLQMHNIEAALKEYEMHIGAFPGSSDGLESLLDPPSNVDETQWDGPYLDGNNLPTDSWGHEFHYRYPGENSRDFDLWSSGPDGQEGSEDDIKNWSDE